MPSPKFASQTKKIPTVAIPWAGATKEHVAIVVAMSPLIKQKGLTTGKMPFHFLPYLSLLNTSHHEADHGVTKALAVSKMKQMDPTEPKTRLKNAFHWRTRTLCL